MIRILAALLAFAGTAVFAAAEPPAAIDVKTLDKSIISTLREVHDRGADLFNMSKDYSAAYRLYEGSLLTVKPLISHRPDVQKTIEEGLTAAGKEQDPDRKAFLLHEVIEKVRADLKGSAPKPVESKPKETVTPKPMDPKPMESKPKESAPMPRAKETATITGKVAVGGKPLAEGTVTFVSTDKKMPKTVSAVVKEGNYILKDLPVGKYAVSVASEKAGAVPAKFAAADTSGLTFQAQTGANQFDIELK